MTAETKDVDFVLTEEALEVWRAKYNQLIAIVGGWKFFELNEHMYLGNFKPGDQVGVDPTDIIRLIDEWLDELNC